MYQFRQFLRYLARATNAHGVHSPFVFDFCTKVLPHQNAAQFAHIDQIKARAVKDQSVLEITDFGAGYGGEAKAVIHKTVQQVMRSSARGMREGALLSRLCQHYAPQEVLELGTNLGFSGLYLLSGLADAATLRTIEGAAALAARATDHFKAFGRSPQQHVGEFSQVLAQQIDWASFKPGLVLLDGNHREQATLDYFEFLLPRVQQRAIFILDDIYWSSSMTAAWEKIKAHPRVTVSIDLFSMGLIFLDRPQAKEHFTLRFRSW